MSHTFTYSSPLPVSAAEAYAWHMRPGAFERLCPPWDPVRVLKREGRIDEGGTVEVSVPIGPFRKRWTAEHFGFVPGREFHDKQVRGPFARFEHTHRFDPQGATASELTDHLEYDLPLGGLGSVLAGASIRGKFKQMFAYRHRVTQADLAAHAQYRDREPLSIAITGASGLVGTATAAFLSTGGHQVTKLVRAGSKSRSAEDGIPTADWNSETGAIELPGGAVPQAVVHLAGENIAGSRWSAKVKERIKSSRVGPTRQLCERLARQAVRPQVLVCASAIGFYGDRGDERLTEESSAGEGFLVDVCREWERATQPAVDAGIRVVNLRFGMIVTTAGGALAKMLPPFRFGGGGIVGSGRQWWSWILLDDVVGVIHHALMTAALRGPVNAVAPESLTNYDFTKTLGRVLRRPTVVPLPAFAARLVLGEMADELLLCSARVVPEKLLATSYAFRFPALEDGLQHVLGITQPTK